MSLHRFLIAAVLGPELIRWKARGHTPIVWWRDDDARHLTPALERLLALSDRFDAPITIAAVPDGDVADLVKACRGAPAVELAIHGFRHENRALPGRPAGEVNDQDSLGEVMAELSMAIDVFERAGVEPRLFVPPWNNAHPTLKRALGLRNLDLSGYDQFRAAEAAPARLDAHLDVMRWKPEPRFRGALRFLLRAQRLLAHRRRTLQWDEPLGLLTHHLHHDENAWRFLADILAVVRPVTRARAMTHGRSCGEVRPGAASQNRLRILRRVKEIIASIPARARQRPPGRAHAARGPGRGAWGTDAVRSRRAPRAPACGLDLEFQHVFHRRSQP